MAKKRILQSLLISGLVIIILSGCVPKLKIPDTGIGKYPGAGGPKKADEPVKPVTIEEKLANQNKIKKFDSLDELKEKLETSVGSSGGYSGFNMLRGPSVADDMLWGGFEAPTEGLQAKADISAPGTEGAGSADYSKTNVQVEGVDEADIIKTDGKYIYSIVKNNLFISSAYPAETAKVLSKIEFKSRPQDIYIKGDRLAIHGRDDKILRSDMYMSFKRRNNYTFLKVFDIKDRRNPKLVRSLDFEGNYNNSRMIGDYIYFITTNFNYQYIENEPLLPRTLENGEALKTDCSGAVGCLLPDIYYIDMPYDAYNFTTITAINLKDASIPLSGDVYLMSQNQNMFVSHNNIYLSYTKHMSEYELEAEVLKEIVMPRLSDKSKNRILEIENVENYILNPSEKRSKITRIIESYMSALDRTERTSLEKELKDTMLQRYKDISKELEKTVVHKIGISNGNLNYKTYGSVPGKILNQFSMDEKNGYFRVATTKNRTWSRYEENTIESYNNLYVLDENMKVVGSLEKLAIGERIYSVRFMQDRAYMVTFKQVDPLFVIDLKNPQKPVVLGELKIPGFSNYLHPYDNNTLIGIGKDTSLNEWGGVRTGGLKISLFDVTNVNNPKETDNYIMGDIGSDSIALHDHKAFLFSKEKNLLVLPVSIRESTGSRGARKLVFSGAAVFNVNKGGFTLLGKIDHSEGGKASPLDYWRGHSYYDNTVKRSLYIDDVLYTFSNNYIGINRLSDLESVKKLRLTINKSVDDDFTIIN